MDNLVGRAEELYPGLSWTIANVNPEEGVEHERVRVIVGKHVYHQLTHDFDKEVFEGLTDEQLETVFEELAKGLPE